MEAVEFRPSRMIVLNLSCSRQHRFEGWFASIDEFSRQSGEGLVVCPICGDAEIERLPSAPHLLRGADRQAEPPPEPAGSPRGMLELLQQALQNSEDVGERFPDEARRIHYHEAPQRTIRGLASRQETHDLLDEGILVLPLQIPPTGEMH